MSSEANRGERNSRLPKGQRHMAKTYVTRTPRKVNPQAMLVKQLCALWNTATVQQQGAWNALADTLNNALTTRLAGRKTALGTFIGHNSTLCACGMAPTLIAPQTEAAPVLPPLSLSATFNADTGLALTMAVSAPFQARVLVYGARPLLPGRSLYDTMNWRVIDSLDTLEAGSTVDLTASYLKAYRVTRPGYTLALKLVPVSVNGFRGAETLFTAEVTSA